MEQANDWQPSPEDSAVFLLEENFGTLDSHCSGMFSEAMSHLFCVGMAQRFACCQSCGQNLGHPKSPERSQEAL